MREVEPVTDPETVIEAALDAPIGSPPLEELARGAQRVVILVDDMTRPTPADRLLPAILKRLERAGISPDAICILVATGTHRPMTQAELVAKVGPDVLASYEVVNHDYRQPDTLVQRGSTPSGVPITLNRRVAEADFVLAVGNIVPHRYCGWAGGAKMIQPGVGGEATTAATHLMITKDPGARLGVVENRVRQEMEAVAEQANLKFIVNTILDRYANIVDVVAGDFRLAFRQGIERARGVYSAELKGPADIVLASAYPSDINFWQAGKALYSADIVVREGGIIILASPCYEGVGEHQEFAELLQYDYEAIESLLNRGQVHDRVGAAAALAVAVVKARAAIWFVTAHITAAEAEQMGSRRFETIQVALDAALQLKGDTARVTVLHEATEILPILPT
jgi:nickel-dependent lactate racemase